MIDSGRARLLMVVLILCALSLAAQTRFTLVGTETVQRRLDLYKGNDSSREAALLKLFSEAGCSTANLSEQPVPHRKQPNIICMLPGSTPEVIVIGAHFDHVSEGDGIVFLSGIYPAYFRNEEPISSLWNCLNVSGIVSVIVQRLPKLANRHPETAVKISPL
jgi:hypothetical protein